MYKRQALIAAALRHFSLSKFTYTLSPPLLGRDSVDEFLFDTRRGFCEHFASSFVFLMRAAGMPARVVTGYQGGEINPVDDYLEVRQSDAHAWAEVWVANQGWLRADPTATVAPSRVQGGLAMAVPEGEPLPLALRPAFSWVREIRYRLDAVNNGWNQWILGYNPQRQKELLERLGMQSPDWHAMTIAMSVLCGLIMLALAGCVPLLPHTDWVPQMQGGKLVRERCWGSPAIEYQAHGLVLISRIGRWPDNRLRMEVRFTIPPGLTVTPLEPVVVITAAGVVGRQVAIDGINRHGNPALPLTPPGQMNGYALEIGRARPPGHYWLFVSLDASDSPNFSVTLPSLNISDTVVAIPPIHFNREMRLQLAAPSQC